jgi:hypothetical protein
VVPGADRAFCNPTEAVEGGRVNHVTLCSECLGGVGVRPSSKKRIILIAKSANQFTA